MFFPQRLFLQGRCGATRALTGACVGAGALAANRQTTLVAHATVGAQIDQTLDRQLHFAAQIALDGVAVDLFADLFQFLVGQILDLFRVFDAGRFADLARTEDSRPGPGPLMRTSSVLMPYSWATRPADSAAT